MVLRIVPLHANLTRSSLTIATVPNKKEGKTVISLRIILYLRKPDAKISS